MSPSEKEHWRYTFAGQAMQGIIANTDGATPSARNLQWCIEMANALILELEKTAKTICDHSSISTTADGKVYCILCRSYL